MINDLGKILFNKLVELREKNNGKIDIESLDGIIEQFVETIKSYITDEEELKIFNEISKISDQIQQTKKEISSVDQGKLNEDFISDATLELNSVTQDTEKSTEIILENVEIIQEMISSIAEEQQRKKALDSCTKIFEACNFQDITGQRISKVTKTFSEIEKSISALMKTFKPKVSNNVTESKEVKVKNDQNLLSGPQKSGSAPTQEEIDNLFDSL